MSISRILIAKSNNGKALSLYQHLNDTVGVMEYLLKHYVAPAVINATGTNFEDFNRLAIFTAATHDIGKATNAFQQKIVDSVPQYAWVLRENGIIIKKTGMEKETPHNLAGATILSQYCNIDDSICEIIAAHHGKPREKGKTTKFSYQFREYSENYYTEDGKSVYETAWDEIYEYAIQKADVSNIHNLSVQCQMIMSGLLVMADWIASNDNLFPLNEDNYVENLERGTHGVKQFLKLYGTLDYNEFGSSFMDDALFFKRFEFHANDMQLQTMDAANAMAEPGIMIIEAPMGLGKTEAALAAAEVMASGAGSGGVYFGLPTRGTADAMYSRAKRWVDSVTSKHSSIILSHGMADFNEEYRDLIANAYDEDPDGVSVNSWMLGRHRRLLPCFAVGTVDQALFVALKKKFLMLLHLGIAAKTVIIDEVHSYDDYMSEYMKAMLSWLGIYHVPVILLSATLTKEKRKELVSAYLGYVPDTPDIETDYYPSLICTDGGNVRALQIVCKDLSSKSIRIQYLQEESLLETLSELLSNHGCAGIICDTVGFAQKTYELLKASFDNSYRIVLLHSRYLPEDRNRLESQVLELVGKRSVDRDKVIIIGTQVLEQSLDIDFDIIITEKCPIDMLLQRVGRLHRHNRKNRPKMHSKPICYILQGEETDLRAKRIYNEYIIEKTDKCLSDNMIITIPDDIRTLTEVVYDLSRDEDTEIKQKYINKKKELRSKAEAYILPVANDCDFKGLLTMDNKGIGGVRIGINSIDVILLKKSGEHYVTFSGVTIQKNRTLINEEIRNLLKNKLSIRYDDDLEEELESNHLCFKNQSWMNNPYLENENILILDEQGRIRIGKHDYEYSTEYGWRKLE